jgi:ParB family chromosome partitioning protein
MATRHGLGRGLSALIQDVQQPSSPPAPAAGTPGPGRLPVASIRPGAWQPRRHFAPEALAELVESIRAHGVLQPLLVRQEGDTYTLIAGERRLRAAIEVGLTDVPVTVMNVADHEALELALIENLQRQDLNVIEEAEGYRTLVEKFGLTQEEIARRVGKARASVANTLRLLTLPLEVRQKVSEGRLSPGHAKVLLGVTIEREQTLLAERVVREGLSVRTLERIVERIRRAPRRPRELRTDIPASHLSRISDVLHQHFGTSVRIRPCRTLASGRRSRGVLEIDFYTGEDLDRVLALLGVSDKL